MTLALEHTGIDADDPRRPDVVLTLDEDTGGAKVDFDFDHLATQRWYLAGDGERPCPCRGVLGVYSKFCCLYKFLFFCGCLTSPFPFPPTLHRQKIIRRKTCQSLLASRGFFSGLQRN